MSNHVMTCLIILKESRIIPSFTFDRISEENVKEREIRQLVEFNPMRCHANHVQQFVALILHRNDQEATNESFVLPALHLNIHLKHLNILKTEKMLQLGTKKFSTCVIPARWKHGWQIVSSINKLVIQQSR